MSDGGDGHKVPIIVAAIGVVGVLGAALIANWDKIFPSPPTPTTTSSTAAPSPGATQPHGPLAAPVQLSPKPGSIFSEFPRTTELVWDVVPGASSYTLEIDCFQCCKAGRWCTEVGANWKFVPGLSTTTYSFDWVGAQPGRWRVWAIDDSGRPGQKSNWSEFEYTK
jgi:hypothetical protein